MEAQNLSELFGARIFRTPDYQRGYSWEEKQLAELWDDLEEIPADAASGGYKKHYTGMIFLKESRPGDLEKWYNGAKFFDVVDGQQRLTTISILLFELLKATKTGYAGESREDLIKKFIALSNRTGESVVYKFGYSNTNQNHKFLLHEIFENGKEVLPVDYRNHYTDNLQFAKNFFSKKIQGLPGGEEKEKAKEILYQKLTTSLLFDVREVENDLDVQAVFETMNNRGKPLSTLEKLKNRLIYLAVRLDDSRGKQELREKINDAWGKIYTQLARDPGQVLDEDIFLSAHLSLYRKPEDYAFSEVMAGKKVFEMFCNRAERYEEEPVTRVKIERYILNLSALAPVWYEIHHSSSRMIHKILTLDSRKEVKIFLAAIINEKTDKQDVILDRVEQILFRNRVPGIWLMDERILATWARELYNKEKTLEELLGEMDAKLAQPVNRANIVDGFKNLFTYERGAKGFHRWGALKYFLFEYEEYLKKEYREAADKVTLPDYEDTTIEHVIPQHFWDHWQTEVDEVTNAVEEHQVEQARKVLLNTLGNLTLLKGGKNPELGNKSWERKKERFSTGSYNEIAISKHDTWTKASIAVRGKDLLRFLETKVQGLSFNDPEIEKVLFYDDYIIKVVYGQPRG
jgi:hypothetical protein